MKATIKNQVSNARNYGSEKETVAKYVILAKTKHCNEVREIVDCRVYMGRSKSASTVYASIWIRGDNVHTSGTGSASGWGYHKESAAVGTAISNAEIELYGDVYESSHRWNYEEKRENTPAEISRIKRRLAKKRAYINGVGDSAVRAALLAIAKAAGARGKLIFVSL